MKKFDKIIIFNLIIAITCLLIVNCYSSKISYDDLNRQYMVDINRIELGLNSFEKEKNTSPASLGELTTFTNEKYDSILDIKVSSKESYNREEIERLIKTKDDNHTIIITEDNYYIVEYKRQINNNNEDNELLIIVNCIIVFIVICELMILVYIRQRILAPFNRLSTIPLELSKGNLTKSIEESSDKYFGKYIWGMNMLIDVLEKNKKRELELIKEKKVLLLSLSHDIKTPLSAIKLYAQALQKNLYKSEDKKNDIYIKIDKNVNEIEKYISAITDASRNEIMEFEFTCTSMYINKVLEAIEIYYKDRLRLQQIDFIVSTDTNCVVYANEDRLIEVIQNIVENAIKYGDGERITINTSNDKDKYIIEVINTGCELDKNMLPHIFDSFYRGNNVGKESGSGLGLYICRQLINGMNGEISGEILENDLKRDMLIRIELQKA